MSVSKALAEYVVSTSYNDLPDRVVEMTKKSFLDAMGVTLAAGGLCESCKAFVELAREMEGKQEATIIGYPHKVPTPMAAFANGAMAHALDFEDAHDGALVHSYAAPVPAALALAESIGEVDGKRLLTALAVGSDIVCRLGLALNENPLESGWFIPPVLGAFGAAAAAGKILRLDEEQILDSFSLTLCQATCSAQLRYSPHSDIRAIRDAFGAKAGVFSALLAKKGIKGFESVFEGKAGVFSLYSKGNYNQSALIRGLGETFEGANVSFKPWPTCRGTHAYIEAALDILSEVSIRIEDITGIKVIISSVNRMLCEPAEVKENPLTDIDAKFSLPFVVATALKHKRVTLDNFFPEALKDKDILKLAAKTTYEVDPSLSIKNATGGFLEITANNNKVYSKRIDHAYGHPGNPVSHDALVKKFQDCAGHAANQIPEINLKRAIDMIFSLEKVVNIGEVVNCFKP